MSMSQSAQSEASPLFDRHHLPESQFSLAFNFIAANQEGCIGCHLSVAAYREISHQAPALFIGEK